MGSNDLILEFESVLSNHKGDVWGNHFLVDTNLNEKLKTAGVKRWMCSVNGQKPLHIGLLNNGEGGFFIILNKSFCKLHAIDRGSKLHIQLKPDYSEYGMEISEEFRAVLDQNDRANSFFEELTPGKKRNLIFFVGNVKSSDIKIRRAFVVCEHLVSNQGNIDFKSLNSEMKEANRAAKIK